MLPWEPGGSTQVEKHGADHLHGDEARSASRAGRVPMALGKHWVTASSLWSSPGSSPAPASLVQIPFVVMLILLLKTKRI